MKFDLKKYLARWRRYGIAGAAGGAMALGGASAYGVEAVLSGQLINVDLNGSSGNGGQYAGTFSGDLTLGTSGATEASVAWADDTPGDDTWNGLEDPRVLVPPGNADGSGSFFDLLDSLGDPTGVNVSWNAFNRTYANYSNGRFGKPITYGPNADGWVLQYAPADLVFEFTGLVEGGVYDVAVNGVLGRMDATVDGTTKITPKGWPDGRLEWAWSDGAGGFDELDNYEIWEGVVAGPGGTLTVAMETRTGFDEIGGMQIYTPEPSTFVLGALGAGLAGLLLSFRRRD